MTNPDEEREGQWVCSRFLSTLQETRKSFVWFVTFFTLFLPSFSHHQKMCVRDANFPRLLPFFWVRVTGEKKKNQNQFLAKWGKESRKQIRENECTKCIKWIIGLEIVKEVFSSLYMNFCVFRSGTVNIRYVWSHPKKEERKSIFPLVSIEWMVHSMANSKKKRCLK